MLIPVLHFFQNHSNRIAFVHSWDDFQHQPPWCCISPAIRVDYSTTWAIHIAVFASSYLDPQTSGISRWSWNGLEAGLAEYDVWWCVDCSQLMTMPDSQMGRNHQPGLLDIWRYHIAIFWPQVQCYHRAAGFDVMWFDFDIFVVQHPTNAIQKASEGA